MPAQSSLEEMPLYFIATGDDGLWSSICGEPQLKQSVHDVMCVCKQPWEQCGSEGVPETCRLLDDADEWSGHSPFPRFSWGQQFEDGYIRVTLLTDPAVRSRLFVQGEELPERPKVIAFPAHGFGFSVYYEIESCNQYFAKLEAETSRLKELLHARYQAIDRAEAAEKSLATCRADALKEALEAVHVRKGEGLSHPVSSGDSAYAKAFEHAERAILAIKEGK